MLNIAILTVSDTRTINQDKSGDLLKSLITEDGHCVARRAIVKDLIPEIRCYLSEWINDPAIHVIISTGGTGISPRDVTVEAHIPLYDKHLSGFSTIFHMLSYQQIGLSTIQSRVCAGIAANTCLFALPGSPSACRDGWCKIIKHQLDDKYKPCNFVDIMFPKVSDN